MVRVVLGFAVLGLAACSAPARQTPPRSSPSTSEVAPSSPTSCGAEPCSESAAQKEAACRTNDFKACLELGNLLVHSENPKEADLETAFAHYGRACRAGLPEACANLGAMYEEGWGTPKDLSKALELYQQTCNEGTQAGCLDLGYLYETGKGTPQNFALAVRYYEMACNTEDTQCANLGILVGHGQGTQKDLSRAAALAERACNAGSGAGCQNLATMKVQESPADLDAGGLWSRKGCDLKFAPACAYNVAVRAAQADRLISTPSDKLRTACAKNEAPSCYALGLKYLIGLDTEHDLAEADAWFAKACKAGLTKACRKSVVTD